MRKGIVTAIIVLSFALTSYAQLSTGIVGVWENGTGKMKVEIYEENNRCFGKVIWLYDHSNENIRVGELIIKDLEFEKTENIYNNGLFLWGANKLKCKIKPIEDKKIKIMLNKLVYSREIYWTKTRI